MTRQISLSDLFEKKLGLRADAVANGLEVLKALETLPYNPSLPLDGNQNK